MAKSGVNIAQELLILDLEDNTFDSLFDPWALLADEEFTDLFPLGTLTVDVQDEGGKFQVNAMVIRKREGFKAKNKADDKQQQNHERYVRNILWRLLRAEPFSMEDGDARKIIDALIDWMDTGDGDGEEEYGAEDGYYQSLDLPYSCKNGPIESIEELLLVKGITKELLYGTEEKPPLAPLLTVVNDTGKININTADVLLLQALAPGLDKTTSENMIEFREDEANKTQLEDSNWYKNVPSFPGDIELTKNQISTSSNFFTIRAAAEFNAQQKIITTTVERKDEQIKILRWDSE
jgi:general secretion pathway protein K